MTSEFQQNVVNELSWSIDWGEGPYTKIADDVSEQFFFDNFTGSKIHIDAIERMYVMEMFLAADLEGKNGNELHDTFVNEHITKFMVKAEKVAGKIADKLVALYSDAPNIKDLKGITPEQLIMAFKTENDLIMLADKLGMTLDVKEESTLIQIAKTITEWKQ